MRKEVLLETGPEGGGAFTAIRNAVRCEERRCTVRKYCGHFEVG